MGLFDEPELGLPSLSMKGIRKGWKLEGIVLPTPKRRESGGYDLVPYREDPDRDQAGNVRLFPSGDPIMVGQVRLQTKLRGWDATSQEFQMKLESFPEAEDDGVRVWYIGSKYATQAVRAAMKRLRKPPEIGGTFTIEATAIKQGSAVNKETQQTEKYTYPDLAVSWTPSTPEGLAVVKEYTDNRLKLPADEPAQEGSSVFSTDDSSASSTADDDAPPY